MSHGFGVVACEADVVAVDVEDVFAADGALVVVVRAVVEAGDVEAGAAALLVDDAAPE